MADEEIDNAEAPCLACGGTLREGVAQPRTTYAERGRFSIRECVTCGLGRTSPTLSPSELECFYSGQYGYDVHALVSAEKRWRARRIGKTLALDGVTSALDVGCMYGYLLEELRAQGVARVEGVELARHPVEQARRRGLSVYCGTLETYAETRRDPFDLIIAQHVLEHVPNPHSFLRTAASLLNTGGRLVICVPNYASRMRKRLGEAWGWYQVPVHIHHFTQSALERLLHQAGFAVDRTGTRGGDSLFVLMSLNNLVTRTAKPGGRAPSSMQRTAIAVASLALRPYYYAGDDELLMIARHP